MAVAPAFLIFKSVCQSQNKKIVGRSKNIICVCWSQNSHTLSHVTCKVSHVKCCMSPVIMSHVPNATDRTPAYSPIFQIENVSVSHENIKCVCQSQKSHIELALHGG